VRILLAAALATVRFSLAFGQSPTNQQIEQILADPPRGSLGVCFGSQRSMGFDVCAAGPLQRIALAAREAKKAYRPFTFVDVTDALRENTWMVFAAPSKPVLDQGTWHVTPAAREALFQPSGQRDGPVTRPVRLTVEPASWGNALTKFTSAGVTAYFSPDDLPPGSLDLIILTSGREQRYVLKESERLQIR
jgi:hypothetical protein